MKHRKNYKEWMGVKSFVNNKNPIRTIKEGEIWWAAIGENVGVEMDGKSKKFSRPVLIFRKHSKLCFTGIPLSTQEHEGNWYVPFIFKEKRETAIVVQARLMSAARLYEKMGEISKGDFRRIEGAFAELFIKNVPQC